MVGATLAQEETDSAPDPPPPESQPVAGYEPTYFNPFFIQSSDGLFRLNIGAYAQVR